MNKLKQTWKPLVSITFWGASFIATKALLDYITPLAIIFTRLLFAIPFLVIIVIIRKRSFRVKAADFKWIVILALIASLHMVIQVTGLKFTTASNTGWIIGFAPIFMALLSIIFFKEKLNLLKGAGIAIAFFGVLLLISKGDFASLNVLQHKGDFLVLGSAFTWGVYSLVGKKITLNYPPMMTVLYLFVLMALFLGPFTVDGDYFSSLMTLPLISWIAVIFLGVFSSGVAYVLWAQAMSEMDSSKVGAFLYLEPFVTLFTAWTLLNEQITFIMVLSGLIIIGGVIMVNYE